MAKRRVSSSARKASISRPENSLAIQHSCFNKLSLHFYQQRLFDDVHICLVREGHPRVGRKLTMAGFSEEPHVTVAAIWNRANLFEVALRSRGIERRSALRVGHYLALPTIIRETDLLACRAEPSRRAADEGHQDHAPAVRAAAADGEAVLASARSS